MKIGRFKHSVLLAGFVLAVLFILAPSGGSAQTTTSPPSAQAALAANGSAPTGEDKLALADSALRTEDYARAASIYSELANAGVAAGQYNLGMLYLEGKGVAKDETTGFGLVRKAAEQKLPAAISFLNTAGQLSFDATRSALTPLADAGDADAMVALLWLLAERKSQIFQVEAVKWAETYLAQKQCPKDKDLVATMELLGQRFELGMGLPKDANAAMKMYLKGADCGNYESEIAIGKLHFRGIGVPQNPELAMQWFNKAIVHGGTGATKAVAQYLSRQRDVAALIDYLKKLPKQSVYGWQVGMSKDEVLRNSRERPIRINKYVTSAGTREQWVYDYGLAYLYFDESGILRSYQERGK